MPHPENQPGRLPPETIVENFFVTFGTWQTLTPVSLESEQRFQEIASYFDFKRTPQIADFLETTRKKVLELRNKGQYDDALAVIADTFTRVPTSFTKEDQNTVNRILCYRAGHTFEHRAEYGDLSQLPLTDERRRRCFLQAATCYMQADIIAGYTTDYAMRVFQSLGGAGEAYGPFRVIAFAKFADDKTFVVDTNNPRDMAIVNSLIRKATSTQKGKVPGGGNAYFIAPEDLPRTDVN